MFSPELLKEAFVSLLAAQNFTGDDLEIVDDIIVDADFEALAHTLWNGMESVYVYQTNGKYERAMNYRSQELFNKRACFICNSFESSSSDILDTLYCNELWLLEDYTFAIVSCFYVIVPDESFRYETAFRAIKSIGSNCELTFPLDDLDTELSKICEPYYEHQIPYYEY